MSSNVKWDQRFLELAWHISKWSRDPSTQVGAVIATDYHSVVGLGYNGFPRGVDDNPARYDDRETKYSFIVHAEVNAIIMAGERARGSSLYVFPSFGPPCICNECCKLTIQSGIKEVVSYAPDPVYDIITPGLNQRWRASLAASQRMMAEAGVAYRGIPRCQ